MVWFFNKKEKRSLEEPQVEKNACEEAAEGIGLLNRLLNLKDFDAMKQSAFFSAVNLISNSIASMRWKVKGYDGENEVPEDFYVDHLFDGVNVGHFLTIKNIITDVILHGNGFCYIHRNAKGDAESLEYLPFGQCTIFYNSVTGVLLYSAPRISKKYIEPINILHFRMLTVDGIEGKPLTVFANNTIKLNGSSEKAALDYFGNGMTVQGVLSTDAPRLTKEQRQTIRQAWAESQLGSGSGLAVLENGMKYSPVSSNSKDAELLESRAYNVSEIARYFNILPTMLGDLSKTAYNTIEQSELQFVLNTLTPYVSMLEEELNRKLISFKDKKKFYIDVLEEDLVRSDKQTEVSTLITLREKGIVSINEVRIKLGYPPVEGGDELHALYTDVNQNKVNQDNTSDKENETNKNIDEE